MGYACFKVTIHLLGITSQRSRWSEAGVALRTGAPWQATETGGEITIGRMRGVAEPLVSRPSRSTIHISSRPSYHNVVLLTNPIQSNHSYFARYYEADVKVERIRGSSDDRSSRSTYRDERKDNGRRGATESRYSCISQNRAFSFTEPLRYQFNEFIC